MNTDGEWNDGRQARFVPTYADYYDTTGNLEYLERAVAAYRSSVALMDIEENHANMINSIISQDSPGQGYSPENIFHGGPGDTCGAWTGFNWGGGGGHASAAYLLRHFGSVWVDGRAKTATPIDGATASITKWDGNSISLQVASALVDLPYPYTEARGLTVKFGAMPREKYTVKINDEMLANVSRAELEQGLEIALPKDTTAKPTDEI